MKKILYIVLCFCLIGCSSKKDTTKNSQKDNNVIQQQNEEKPKDEDSNDIIETTEDSNKTAEDDTKSTDQQETTVVNQSDAVDDPETTTDSNNQESNNTTTNVSVSNTAASTGTGDSLPLSQRSRIVVIDAGHGGVDSGCYNGNYLEKNITLEYALIVGSILQNNGIQVVYTRTGDTTLAQDSYRLSDGTVKTNDLRARAELGQKYNAALYVSLHVDSTDSYATGYSVYVHSGHSDSVSLGNLINGQLAALGYTNSRGVLNGSDLRVLRCNTTIACLIELGFITGDLNILIDPSYQQSISQAIANGIISKLNSGWNEPDLVLQKQPDLY